MSTLADIQRLVDKAQDNSAWPQIATTIGQLTDLEFEYREDFANRLKEQLNKKGLQANPEPINVKKIVDQVKADGPTGSTSNPTGPWIVR